LGRDPQIEKTTAKPSSKKKGTQKNCRKKKKGKISIGCRGGGKEHLPWGIIGKRFWHMLHKKAGGRRGFSGMLRYFGKNRRRSGECPGEALITKKN